MPNFLRKGVRLMLTERVKEYCMESVKRDLLDVSEKTSLVKTKHGAAICAGKIEYLKGVMVDLYED